MNTTEPPRQGVLRIALRLAIGLVGVVLGFVAVALYFRWPMVADIWPWSGYYAGLSPLSFYFLSSIAAAICAPVLWIALADKLHAAAPGAINLIVAFVGIGVFMFQEYLADPANTRLLHSALFMAASVVLILLIYFIGRKARGADLRPLPAPVRYSYYIFIIALVTVGSELVLKRPNILPWQITPEGSVVYGWIFLGASVYFIFAVTKPTWENAAGQLMGFLAYDIVLILPFIRHFSDVKPQQELNLIIYTAVVVYSGLLGIYYLFFNQGTRLFGGAKPA